MRHFSINFHARQRSRTEFACEILGCRSYPNTFGNWTYVCLCVVIIDKYTTDPSGSVISWTAQMARCLSQKRGRPASWPAPFCVSACFRGVPIPRSFVPRPSFLLPMIVFAKPASSRTLSLLRYRPAGRLLLLSLPACGIFARTRAFVPARGSFVNFVVSCTRLAEELPRLHFSRMTMALYF